MDITANQYKRFSQLVYQECGINLHDGKKQLLIARLSKRLRHTGIKSPKEYLKIIENNGQELTQFLDAVSTNHTYFFREKHHFTHLTNEHQIIWCAAASSGEEPYSIAIDCLEKGFTPTILATDISTKVLQMGQVGIYPFERAKDVPPHILKKYFQKGRGKYERQIRVKQELQRMVTFKRFNLLTDTPPPQTFDVIFCRNVLIYFDNPVKSKVIDKLYNVIKPNGLLIIGGAESLNTLKHRFKYISPSIYKKPA